MLTKSTIALAIAATANGQDLEYDGGCPPPHRGRPAVHRSCRIYLIESAEDARHRRLQ